MITSAFFTVARLRGGKAAAVLAVSDECLTGKIGFRDPRFRAAEERAIEMALCASGMLLT